MAKLYVRDVDTDSEIPFLRGTLIRSLNKVGVDYEDARHIANQVRDQFTTKSSVTVSELSEAVVKFLAESQDKKIVEQYRHREPYSNVVRVDYGDGDVAPFSRGLFMQRLQVCGLKRRKLFAITKLIQKALKESNAESVDAKELRELTYWAIAKYSRASAEKYLTWSAFYDSNLPLIILIGGAPNCGKSTIATELSNQLDIIRSQSTDMLREVMRIMLSSRLAPEIHRSSFETDAVLKSTHQELDKKQLLIEAYHRQADKVEIACEAVINRALNERVSIIVEGVHVRPSMMQRIQDTDAIVVPIIFAVFDKKQLKQQIKGRSKSTKTRRAKRYLDHFEAIWQMQSMLASEADDLDIDVIENKGPTRAVNRVTQLVMDAAAKRLKKRIDELRPEQFTNPFYPPS